MKTLLEDLNAPLDKIDRKWLRRTILVILTIIIVPIGAIWGSCTMLSKMYSDCW